MSVSRKIKLKLSVREMDRALRELEEHKKWLKRKTNELVEALTEYGVEVAKAQVRQLVNPDGENMWSTGQLEDSITGVFDPASGVGVIKTDLWYAVYVEFGTGIVGEQQPHPDPIEWQYDSNDRGIEGWWYYNDRDHKWHHTWGYMSRPFMYNTAKILQDDYMEIAKEVFKRD
jgi:hypothetical protein